MFPISTREWTALLLGALLASGSLLAVYGRYEVQRGAGLSYLRIDRWTGSVERCGASCVPVPKGTTLAPAPATPANPFDRFDPPAQARP